MHFPCLNIIAHNQIKIRFDNTDYRLVKHRKKGFNPIIKVSWHDISTSEIKFLLSSVIEVVGPTVLKKTSDNTDDPDMLTNPLYTGLEAADPADDKVDLYPFALSLV